MLRLQRCVPCLDSSVLTWNATGDCGYATLRRASDDLGAALMPKRAKHPLRAAFRTVRTGLRASAQLSGSHLNSMEDEEHRLVSMLPA